VTGTYLGALSHTLTALVAMCARDVAVRAIVVSESRENLGLGQTIEGLRHFGSAEIPIYPLPRLAGGPESRWREAPSLTRICEVDHV
jgi:dethiobiotin synthetase